MAAWRTGMQISMALPLQKPPPAGAGPPAGRAVPREPLANAIGDLAKMVLPTKLYWPTRSSRTRLKWPTNPTLPNSNLYSILVCHMVYHGQALWCVKQNRSTASAEGTNVAPWAGGCYWRLFAPEAEFSGLPRLLSDSDDAERGSIVNTITNV